MHTAYRCRLYPTRAQAAQLNRTFAAVRYVWNRTLEENRRAYREERRRVGFAEASRVATQWKREPATAWLRDVSSGPPSQAIRILHDAIERFFSVRAGFPKYKARAGRQAAHFAGRRLHVRGTSVRLGLVPGDLRFAWSRAGARLEGARPLRAIVAREPDGRWFVTFVCEVSDAHPLPPTGQSVGVDLGLRDFAVLSNGEHVRHPKHAEQHEARLKRYQRALARKRKGSKRRARAKQKVARAHSRIADARRDFLHKLSTDLVRRHDVIAVEDLNVSGMVRNRRLARAISRSGWGEFRAMLAYKCERYGRRLVVADRWFASSKTCSACGEKAATLALSVREWACSACGVVHDRDVNAAANLLSLAGGQPVAARGDGVRRHGVRPVAQSSVKREVGTGSPAASVA